MRLVNILCDIIRGPIAEHYHPRVYVGWHQPVGLRNWLSLVDTPFNWICIVHWYNIKDTDYTGGTGTL